MRNECIHFAQSKQNNSSSSTHACLSQSDKHKKNKQTHATESINTHTQTAVAWDFVHNYPLCSFFHTMNRPNLNVYCKCFLFHSTPQSQPRLLLIFPNFFSTSRFSCAPVCPIAAPISVSLKNNHHFHHY